MGDANQMKFVQIVTEDDITLAKETYVAPSDKEKKDPQSEESKEEIKASIGMEFTMCDIKYKVEAIGAFVQCKQCEDNEEFPHIVYLQENQLNHVTITSKSPTNIQMPDEKASAKPKDDRVRSPTSAKIAMFENKEKDKDVKPKRPVKKVNKMKVGALNSKFGNLNINPAALKPGGATKISKTHRDDGGIDHKPKVEQAIVPT